MDIKDYAIKEKKRMDAVFSKIEIVSKAKNAMEFHDFASNYFKDGGYFLEKKQFIEAFEAFIISWAYLDCGIKLGYFKVPKDQKEWFTA